MTIDFGKWAFGNKKLIYFLLAVLLIGGIYSAGEMSKLEDPEIKVKTAMVIAVYPGASAHDVEMEVVDPIEKSIRTMGDVDEITSWSYNDMAIIQIELKSTTRDSDVEQCWDMLRRKVSDVHSSLPSGVSVSVKDDFGLVYGMLYAITGEGLTERQLSDYANLVKRILNDLPGVARVDLYGEREECINVSLDIGKLATLGVSPIEILSTLNGQNSTYYAGYYDNGPDRVRIAVADKFRTAEQISTMVIQGHEEDQLRVGDIATVEHSYVEPVREAMTYNEQQALGIAVAAASGTDIVKVGKEVEEALSKLESERLPAGVECHKIFYQPERVTDSLTTFLVNLIESVLIVVAILMLTMGFRSGVIIGISLVMIVIGSFLLLGAADGSMQRVSLAAFILAMGMLVDNAIVIVDGILIDLKMGKPKMEALTSIGKKTAMPLLGATMIAILAFLPIFMSPDTAGVYVRDLFIVLAVSLLLSWILALVHVPLMAERYLVGKIKQDGDTNDVRKSVVYVWLRKGLNFGLRHKYLYIAIAVVLVGLSLVGYKYMKHGFFPDMVYDQLYMEYKLPEGTNSTKVSADLMEIQEYLKSRPEIRDITASIGGTPARYNLVRSIATPSLSYGELIIDFESAKALEKNMDEIQKELAARYPDAYLKLKRYNIMYKKYPIEVIFTGPDPAVLHNLADSARSIMEQTNTIDLITTEWETSVPVLHVDFNQSNGRNSGIGRQDLAMSLLSSAGGIPIGSFYDGTHKQTIYMKSVEDNKPVENLENVPIFSVMPSYEGLLTKDILYKLQNGTLSKSEIVESLLQTTPLKQVSSGIEVGWEDPVVPRFNGQRAQKVMCSPVPGVETEAARLDIAEKIENIPLPVGYDIVWAGEKGASDETMTYLFKQVPLALILMVAILILLFGDYKKPIIIFCGIPLLAIGVVGAMLITGKTFTFCAIVGALGLVGMMMKNCIVLMDEIGVQMESGKEPAEALISSTESRLRPVMMASLTTILGMIPLLGDAMFGSMAAAIMGGLLFSTFATLIFVPVLYALFFKINLKSK